jgi:hypothetical protein
MRLRLLPAWALAKVRCVRKLRHLTLAIFLCVAESSVYDPHAIALQLVAMDETAAKKRRNELEVIERPAMFGCDRFPCLFILVREASGYAAGDAR